MVENNGKIINLNNYLLHPMYEVNLDYETEEEYFQQMILMLMKINGTFQTQLSANELQAAIGDICMELSIDSVPGLTGATNRMNTLILAKLHFIAHKFRFFTSGVSILLWMAIVAVVPLFIKRHKRYFDVLLISGFSIRMVNLIVGILATSMLIGAFICGGVVGIIISNWMNRTTKLLLSGIFLTGLLFTVSIESVLVLSRNVVIDKGAEDDD